jgi:putative FmdB family regulatory protein
MPLYEYRCAVCAASFEKLTKRELADETACPECGSLHPRRLVSVFATFSQSSNGEVAPVGGGCACGGACSCGGH